MRVLVCEAVCGGFWPEAPSGSLFREGRAMLAALVEDLSSAGNVTVEALWDGRLGAAAPGEGVRWHVVDSVSGAREILQSRAAACDATWLIAPETGGMLAELARRVERAGGRLVSPGSVAAESCGDKLALAEWAESRGIATIPTRSHAPSDAILSHEYPVVVKPRDGAGSQATRLVRNDAERDALARETDPGAAWIRQPYVAGRALSVAGIVEEGRRVAWLPVGEQLLSDDGRFTYLGGLIPARGVDASRFLEALSRGVAGIPGLRGYVGCDLIEVPARDGANVAGGKSGAGGAELLLCEINPRLTTSYLGYRRLFGKRLVRKVLGEDLDLRCSTGDGVRFAPDGGPRSVR
jgi:hypothetical protein